MPAPDPAERRKAIVDAAAELFAAQGVSRTTVRQIADASGMVAGSLYHYYPSKHLIVQEIIRGNLDDLLAGYQRVLHEHAEPRARLRALILVSLETALAHPHASEVYQNEHTTLVQQEGFEFLRTAATDIQKIWVSAFEEGVAAGHLRSDIPAPIFYRLIRDAVWLSVRWIQTDSRFSAEWLADECSSVFLDGILTES